MRVLREPWHVRRGTQEYNSRQRIEPRKGSNMTSASTVPSQIPQIAKVFFLTVPKCAGTSIAAYLTSLFGAEEVCPAPWAGIWSHRPADVDQYRLFQGHFDHDFIDGFQGPKLKLTILREPCSRLVSLYDFWRSYSWEYILAELPPPPVNGPAVAKSSDFTEFLRTTNSFARSHIFNSASRQILGAEFDKLAHDQDAIIEKCIYRLETFDWIGITEEFEQSIHTLAVLLGATVPPVEIRSNRTYYADAPGTEHVTKTEPSAEQFALMHELTRCDYGIYNHARQLFEKRVANVVA
jgi:Sulfotransferase family